MKLQDQVLSIELSRKLKEIGIKEESCFAWFYMPDKDAVEVIKQINEIGLSAFTAAELLQMIPQYIDLGEQSQPFNDYFFSMNKFTLISEVKDNNLKLQTNYRVYYTCSTIDPSKNIHPFQLFRHHDANLANALGSLLVYLIENSYVKIRDDGVKNET